MCWSCFTVVYMNWDKIDRRKFLGSTVSASLIGIAGCSGMPGGSGEGPAPVGSENPEGMNDTTPQGMLATAVSDQPAAIGDFESLVLMVSEIEVYSDSSGEDDDEEVESVNESYSVEDVSLLISDAQEQLDGYEGE